MTDPFTATVAKVQDGDTVDVRHNGVTIRVRIAGIDAPETGTPAGKEAHIALERMLPVAARVDIHPTGDTDPYGRLLADVRPVTWSVADRMVDEGHARRWAP